MRFADLLQWVLAHLRRSPGRAAMAGMGVALGAGLLVSLLSLTQGIQDETEASVVWQATPGRLMVASRAPTIPLGDIDVARLARVPGVREALPVLPTSLSLSNAVHHLTGGVVGLALSVHGGVPYRLLAGAPLDPSHPDGVLLSRQAAEVLGFSVPNAAIGASLMARTSATAAGADPPDQTLVVTGVAEELGDQNAVIGLPLAEDLLA